MKKIITHSGNFHADEIIAVAILSLVYKGDIEIVRTRDEAIFATGDFVVDVGGTYDGLTRFDHHQAGGAGTRENGIPYASCGLIWKHFGPELTGSSYVRDYLDKKIMQPTDAIDNGVNISQSIKAELFPYTLQDYVVLHRPSWKHKDIDLDPIFKKLVSFVAEVINAEIVKAGDAEEGQKLVEEAYEGSEDKRIVVMDKSLPWEYILTTHPEPLYAIIPDSGGIRWKIEAVRKDMTSFETRKAFPQEWAGKRGEELIAVSGISGLAFCHNARFLVVAESKESALQVAHNMINN